MGCCFNAQLQGKTSPTYHCKVILDSPTCNCFFKSPDSLLRGRDGRVEGRPSFVVTKKDKHLKEPSSPGAIIGRQLAAASSPSRKKLSTRSNQFLDGDNRWSSKAKRLWNAANFGSLSLIEEIVDEEKKSGGDEWILINSERPYDGSTALFAAAAGGHIAVIKDLINRGAISRIARLDNATPFYIACLMQHIDAAVCLWEVAEDEGGTAAQLRLIHQRTLVESWTPLLAASSRGGIDEVRFLCAESRRILNNNDHRCFLEARDSRGRTSVMLARKHGYSKVAAILEWYLEEESKSIAPKLGESAAFNGTTMRLANGGKWASEYPIGAVPVPPEESSFKVDTTPRRRLDHLHEASSAFGRGKGAERLRPRRIGGVATTFHLDDVIHGKCGGIIKHIDKNKNSRRDAVTEVRRYLQVSQQGFSVASALMQRHDLGGASHEFSRVSETYGRAVSFIKAAQERPRSPRTNQALEHLKKEAAAGSRLSDKMSIHCRQALLLLGNVSQEDVESADAFCHLALESF